MGNISNKTLRSTPTHGNQNHFDSISFRVYVSCVCKIWKRDSHCVQVFVYFTTMANQMIRTQRQIRRLNGVRKRCNNDACKQAAASNRTNPYTIDACYDMQTVWLQTNQSPTNKKNSIPIQWECQLTNRSVYNFESVHRNKTENLVRNDLTHLSLLRAVIPENSRTQHIISHLISIVLISSLATQFAFFHYNFFKLIFCSHCMKFESVSVRQTKHEKKKPKANNAN